jgi:protein transport protein SEC24
MSVPGYPGTGYVYEDAHAAETETAPVLACDPRFVSLSFSGFPKSAAVRAAANIPLAAMIQPLATVEPELVPRAVNFGISGVIRCRACRAYVNCFVELKDQSTSWTCNLCGRNNELPNTYIKEIRDPSMMKYHPELTDPSFEIVAPPEYTVRAPQPPTYVFLIDVSSRAVQSGFVNSICSTIAQSLDFLPGKTRTNVCFVTFDSSVHVYSLKATNRSPHMFVLPDLKDPSVPLPSDLLVNLAESRPLVDRLLQTLPSIHASSVDPEIAFGPALEVAVLIATRIGGKIISFLSGLPTLGIGSLKNRDDPRLLGTEKENTLLVAATDYYKKKAESLTSIHISVDIFLAVDHYCDVATISEIARYTGGQTFFYPGFHESSDFDRINNDLYRVLSRETSWEAVMRVRISRGAKIMDYYGNFFMRSHDLMAVPNCDADKSFIVEFCNEDVPVPGSYVTIQCALL